ncbi:MAG: LysM peptidoglycan-binding domain-containing protein [Pirellulaceae bacterium]|nr:LysM peptidoglycan-binding domain-containing protein [Pirellulaceae bacterium]
METIKTAVVVVLLLAVLYGVYVVLNKPELTPPSQADVWNESAELPQIETGMPSGLDPLRPLPLDKQNAQPSQPTPATAASNEAAGLPAQGGVAEISDSVEAESGVAVRGQPTPADQPDARLASANVAANAAPTPPPTAAPIATDPTATSEPAADSQGSVYAQASNVSAQEKEDFRSIRAFDNAWNSAVAQLQKGQWAESLLTLSFFFHDPDMNGEERQRLIDLLDPLAGKVIYSSEHALEAPHEVKPGERLDSIAEQYQVPVSLLQNINGIAQPESLRPGTQLKVLRGPFRAEIDLKRSELVLFLGKYYAGRFAISVGNDPVPQPTECQVLGKEAGHEYVGPNGVRIPARAADNPYGDVYLDLGNGICVHGSPDSIPSQAGLGCLSLSDADVADIAGILSVGSKVTIR